MQVACCGTYEPHSRVQEVLRHVEVCSRAGKSLSFTKDTGRVLWMKVGEWVASEHATKQEFRESRQGQSIAAGQGAGRQEALLAPCTLACSNVLALSYFAANLSLNSCFFTSR